MAILRLSKEIHTVCHCDLLLILYVLFDFTCLAADCIIAGMYDFLGRSFPISTLFSALAIMLTHNITNFTTALCIYT